MSSTTSCFVALIAFIGFVVVGIMFADDIRMIMQRSLTESVPYTAHNRLKFTQKDGKPIPHARAIFHVKPPDKTVDVRPPDNTVDVRPQDKTVDVRPPDKKIDVRPQDKTVDVRPRDKTLDVRLREKTVDVRPRNKTDTGPGLHVPVFDVEGADCRAIIAGSNTSLLEAKTFMKNHEKVPITPEQYIDWAKNCSNFISRRQYIMDSLTVDEKKFPLAFSILMYKDVEGTERLLRAIYRPQNHYCIHVDSKSKPSVFNAVKAISECLPNVILASARRDVRWGTFTNLEPEIICMRDLWRHQWKYFINLTGQEWPLQTNWNMVQILKLLNGGNMVAGAPHQTRQWQGRWQRPGKKPFPGNVTLVKGAVHVVVSRAFVGFVLHAQVAVDLLQWVRDVKHPDEMYFNSLYFSPQLNVPGAYTGPKRTNYLVPLQRHKIWMMTKENQRLCKGRGSNMICIFGIGDVPRLANTSELIANKFHIDFEPLGLDCMEQLIFDRVRNETLGGRQFNADLYANPYAFRSGQIA